MRRIGHADATLAAAAKAVKPGSTTWPTGLRFVGLAVALATLCGCASARVSDVAEAGGGSTAPAAILVEVTAPAPSTQRQAATTSEAASALERDVIAKLTKAGVAAGPGAPGPIPAGDAVLHLAITEATPGNRVERLLVGFGAGRATLQVRTTLDSPSGLGAALAFATWSDSGRKPGLILPGGVAAATGKVAHLAIGGALDVAWTFRSGLDQDADRTAKAIVGRLKRYYASAGWYWPAAAHA